MAIVEVQPSAVVAVVAAVVVPSTLVAGLTFVVVVVTQFAYVAHMVERGQ